MIAKLKDDMLQRDLDMKKAQEKMTLKIHRLQNENTSLKKSKSRAPFNMSTATVAPKQRIEKRSPSKLAVFS